MSTMGMGFSIHPAGRRMRLALLSVVFVGLGAVIGVGAAAVFSYGWFVDETRIAKTTNLSPQEAERIARGYGEQQLRLVEEASKAESRIPGGIATSEPDVAPVGAESSALVTLEARFLLPGAATTASQVGGAGAWLFVFRAEGIHVAEWRTRDAALEIQVVLSDASGRLLQAGVTLLPREPGKEAANR